MREELGEPPGNLPASLEVAKRECTELKSRVKPPTQRQLADVSSLLRESAATFQFLPKLTMFCFLQ